MKKLSPQEEIIKIFARTTSDIFSLEEFNELIKSGRQLRIKYGVDVTAATLHTGHAVNLWMMRKLQDMGHKVVFLIGDFTTQIGDPTGKSKTRPVISKKEIDRNTDDFIEQVKMVLRFDDPNLIEIRRNSEWFGSMPAGEFLKLLSLVTHARLISRDMFQKRIETSQDIYMHEMIYPILQGYDSVVLESDLTIIGSDQLFNEMLGRFFQEKFGQKPQVIITTKITAGIDGKEKQSKSLGNYIGLAHSSKDKFGRVMSIPDNLIVDYLKVYTEIPLEEVAVMEQEIVKDPMKIKKLLAREIVSRYHGAEEAKKELEWFEQTFSAKAIPSDIKELELQEGATTLDAVLAFFESTKSKTFVKSLFEQGAVYRNQERVNDLQELVASGDVFKVGKRNWFKIIIS
jgi:tyrosyl-tRNA synthetase